ncbi:MAG: hypothetical protein KFB95_05865 [Simkaniaceae bacterium]|nr:MAG: hypothetical protein KFB95_05865 [Simkaniaceae bacterium]
MATGSGPIESIKNWQLHFLQKGDNCASHFVDWISENTHTLKSANGTTYAYKRVVSGVEAYLMPAVVASALLQETTTLGCELITRCTFKKGHDNLGESIATICRLVMAFFATLAADIILLPLFRPDIYQRKKELPPPPLRTPMEILDAVQEFEPFCATEASRALHGSPVSLIHYQNEQKAYHRGGEIESYLWTPIGYVAEKESLQEQPIYKRQEIAFDKPQIGEHLEGFLYPRGTFGVHVKGVSCIEVLPKIFSKTNQMNALILENCSDVDRIEVLDLGAFGVVLSSIRVLSLRGIEEISAVAIVAIAAKFPNLRAIDLRGVRITGGFDIEFLQSHIVVSENINNAQQHLDTVNEKLEAAIRAFIQGDCADPSPIVKLFCTISPTKKIEGYPLLSPAVCFIGNFSCLRGLPIGGQDLHNIIRGLRENFSSLTHVDFSKNKDFRVDHLAKMSELNLHTLKIRDCEKAHEYDVGAQYEWFVNSIHSLFAKGLRSLDIQYVHSQTISRKMVSEVFPFLKAHAHHTRSNLQIFFSYPKTERRGEYENTGTVTFKPLAFG